MNTRLTPENSTYRARKTYKFIAARILLTSIVLDIGESNYVGNYIAKQLNLSIINTIGDLDYVTTYSGWVKGMNIKTVFCFEVLEHLLNPRMFLDNLHKTTDEDVQLFLSTPSRPKLLWNNREHFYEYDKLRFKYLLDKTGWEIIDHNRIRLINTYWDWLKYFKGFRPLLRIFYDFTEIYELRKK